MPVWFLGVMQLFVLLPRHHEIELHIYRDHAIVVEGSIAGLGRLRFIVDTGAHPSVIHSRLARRLGLRTRPDSVNVAAGTVELESATVRELKFGPATVEELEVLILDLSTIEGAMGTRVDAIIGMDVLSLSSLSIDYGRRRLSFDPEPAPAGVSMEMKDGFVGVTAEVLGTRLRLLLDTGSKDLVLFANRIRERLPSLPVVGHKTVLGLGGNQLQLKLDLPHVQIGSQRFGPVRAYAITVSGGSHPGFDGLLGVRGLGVNLLALDFRRRRVVLTADSATAARLREER